MFVVTVAVSFFFAPASAQTPYLDSLKGELKKNLTDSVRVSIYQEIGYHISTSRPEAARAYFFEAYQLCTKNKWRDGMGVSAAYIAQSYEAANQLDSADIYLNRAIDIFKDDTASRAQSNLGALLNEKANVEKARGNYRAAIEHFLQSNDITGRFDTKEKHINLGVGFINIALVFEEMQQYRNALPYCEKALTELKIAEQQLLDTAYRTVIHNCRAQAVLCIVHNKIKTGFAEDAFRLLHEASSGIEKQNNDDLNAFLYTEWGNCYEAMGKLSDALSAYQKALGYARNIDFRKVPALTALGNMHKQKKEYAVSAGYFQKVLATEQAGIKAKVKAAALRSLAEVLLLDAHYRESALRYREYTLLSDSLNESETRIRVNEIENRYQSRQKADSILVLQKSSQLQQLALHKKENQNLFTVAGASLLLFAGLLFYRNLRNKHRLLKQSEQLHRQQITQLEKERQLIAAQSLMKGQEEERSRLAKDLHDGVGGLLSGVKLSLSNMKGNVFLSEENATAVTTIITQLDSSIAELRRVSHNMMPEALIKYGLKEALENYCEGIDRSGQLNIRLQTYGLQQRMEQDAEIILYRIVQELLNNVIRHADAKEVLIQLVREANRFSLTVEDDGKGFDRNSPVYKSGAGLQNVQARAGYLNGAVDIRTKPGEGTSITIEGTVG